MDLTKYTSAFYCNYSDLVTEKQSVIALSTLPQYTVDMELKFSYVETIIHRNISTEQQKNDLEFYEIDIKDIYSKKYAGIKIYTPEDLTLEDKERLNYEISESKKSLRVPTVDEARKYGEAYKKELLSKNKKTLSISEIKRLKAILALEDVHILDKTWMDEE